MDIVPSFGPSSSLTPPSTPSTPTPTRSTQKIDRYPKPPPDSHDHSYSPHRHWNLPRLAKCLDFAFRVRVAGVPRSPETEYDPPSLAPPPNDAKGRGNARPPIGPLSLQLPQSAHILGEDKEEDHREAYDTSPRTQHNPFLDTGGARNQRKSGRDENYFCGELHVVLSHFTLVDPELAAFILAMGWRKGQLTSSPALQRISRYGIMRNYVPLDRL